MFSDSKQQRPKHVLSFHMGYFGGCRRVVNSNRPHAFEVLPFSQRGLYGTFQFAAADDYEASEWLQMFIQTSYSVSLIKYPFKTISVLVLWKVLFYHITMTNKGLYQPL